MAAHGFRHLRIWSRGVDVEHFHPLAGARLPYDRPLWLYVGRVAVEKNIEAFLALDLPGTTLVVGDGPVLAPPTVPSAWASIVMHHDYWGFVRDRLRPGSIVLVNSTVFQGDLVRDGLHVVDLAATDLAVDVGNIMAATVVMVGALAALSGLVSLDSLLEAVPQALPPYRTKHIAVNQDALRAGFGAVDRDRFPAWEGARA